MTSKTGMNLMAPLRRAAARWTIPLIVGMAPSLIVEANDLPIPCAGDACGGAAFPGADIARVSVEGNGMRVDQVADRATLNWQEFNIGADHSVRFEQPRESSVALNRIFDADPSQILGSLSANGQVYLVNPNGMVFGEGAQVDVGALIASTLDVDDEVFNGGGIANALATGNGVAAFSGDSDAAVRIEEGASLSAKEGGRIFVIGADVINAGTLRAPGGQAALIGAKDRVFLQPDGALRGFLIEVGTGGDVSNLGDVIAERGNVSLVGLAVNHAGRISATTTVRDGGSVRLVAQDGANVQRNNITNANFVEARNAGELTLDEGALVEVLPDLSSTLRVTDDLEQPKSSIELKGKNVTLKNGAAIVAPSGNVSVRAANNVNGPLETTGSTADNRIIIEEGARIDVSGAESAVIPMSRNLLEVDLRANEFADAPLQRDGPLRGQTISIDIRRGTPLANVDAAIATVGRTLAERMASGGTIKLETSGATLIESGAMLDVSGGKVTYESGALATTRLRTLDGRLIDIADADPNVRYQDIFNSTRVTNPAFGFSEQRTSTSGRAEPGYVEGKDAGEISIVARDAVLAGTFVAGTQSGRHQRNLSSELLRGSLNRPFDEAPLRGALRIDLRLADNNNRALSVLDQSELFGDSQGFFLQSDHLVKLGADQLNAAEFGLLDLKTTGEFLWSENAAVELGGGSILRVRADGIDFGGQFRSAGGSVDFNSLRDDVTQSDLRMRERSVLSVRGDWINDLPNMGGEGRQLWIKGGSVSLRARGDLDLGRGTIDVGGGGWLAADGEFTGGDGGDLTLSVDLGGADIVLGNGFTGSALGLGGRLALTAGDIRILRNEPLPIGSGSGMPNPDAPDLFLPPSFFQRHGFGSYAITANFDNLVIDDGAQIAPVSQRLQLAPNFRSQVSGSDIRTFSQLVSDPSPLRTGVNLEFNLIHSARLVPETGLLEIGRGARVEVEAGGSIAFNTDQDLHVYGTLRAPGGSIDLRVLPPAAELVDAGLFRPEQGIWLAESAVLSAPAIFQMIPNDQGVRQARTFAGGNIRLDAQRGYVVALAGSRIDVSGVNQTLDLRRDAQVGFTPVDVGLNAGAVDVRAAEGFFLRGQLEGGASTTGGRGGRIRLAIDTAARGDPSDIVAGNGRLPLTDRNLLISGHLTPLNVDVGDAIDLSLNGQGQVHLERILEGGFQDVALVARDLIGQRPSSATEVIARGRIRFDTDLDVRVPGSLLLDAPLIAVTDGVRAGIEANTLQVGLTQRQLSSQALAGASVAGNGELAFHAQWIDSRGTVRFDGLRTLSFTAEEDIRLIADPETTSGNSLTLIGSLSTAAELSLTARQMFASTASVFNVDAQTIELMGGAAPTPVLSAGSTLALRAQDIAISGALKAPLGTLSVVATRKLDIDDGALLSTSLEDQLVPFGRTQGGLDWLYSLSASSARIIEAPPEKRILLDAPAVTVAASAVIDLRGGGDVVASEFVRGPGGSRDLTNPVFAAGSFAIMPSYHSRFGIFDGQEQRGYDFAVSDAIELSAVAELGFAGGTFAKLPARYALLPGALLVTPISDGLDYSPGTVERRLDGAAVVAGRAAVAGSDVRDARFSGFVIESGATLQTRAEIQQSRGDVFFAARAERLNRGAAELARQGGRLNLFADVALDFAATLRAEGVADAVDGSVAFVADQLAIVGAESMAPQGFVSLQAETLNNLNVSSVLLGATEVGDQLNIDARVIRFEADVELSQRQLIAGARDRIEVLGGAEIRSLADDNTTDRVRSLELGANGALLVASSTPIEIDRAGAGGTAGGIRIDLNSSIQANHLAVHGPGAVDLQGRLSSGGGSLDLLAPRISLGEAGEGVVINRSRLDQLSARGLRLRSNNALQATTAFELPMDILTIEAPGIRSLLPDLGDPADENVELPTLRLVSNELNWLGSGAQPVQTGASGSFSIFTSRLNLLGGNIGVDGFHDIEVTANDGIAIAEDTTLSLAAKTSMAAVVVAPAAGVSFNIEVPDQALSLQSTPSNATLTGGIGSSISLRAGSITLDSKLIAPSGLLNIETTIGNLILGDNADLDVSSRTIDFAGNLRASPAGNVTLRSANNLLGNRGSRIDVRGFGANDGALSLLAPNGALEILTDLLGGRNAQVSFDSGEPLALGGLTERLNQSGFAGARHFRQRSGDLVLAGGETSRAARQSFIADAGMVTIDGTIDLVPSSAGQGELTLDLLARDGIVVSDSALLRFASADRQRLTLKTQAIDSEIVIAPNSVVLGDAPRRQVTVEADLDGADELIQLTGLTPFGAVDLLARESYAVFDGRYDGGDQANVRALVESLAVDALQRAAIFEGELRLRPVIDVMATGNLAVVDLVDLADLRTVEGLAGVLRIRAGGDLNLQASLSDGFAPDFNVVGEPINALMNAESWSYELVAGADLASLQTPARLQGLGDLNLAPDVFVRTGSGSIDVFAGRDINLLAPSSTIYTAGRSTGAGNLPFEYVFETYPFGRVEYPEAGGDVRVGAGRDVRGASSRQLISNWMVRLGGPITRNNQIVSNRPTTYGIAFENFAQGIGALGGGSVSLSADRDLIDVDAVVPQSAQHVGDSADVSTDGFLPTFTDNSFMVRGGDHLSVTAGRDLLSGMYYLGRGRAEISAGRDVLPLDSQRSGLLLATNSADFSVQARRDLRLESMFNATLLPQDTNALQTFTDRSFFNTYGAQTRLSLASIAGDITIAPNLERIATDHAPLFSATVSDLAALAVLPGSVEATALSQDIRLTRPFTLSPAARGGMQLLAKRNIVADEGNILVSLSDADVNELPSADRPTANLIDFALRVPVGTAPNASNQRASQPVHLGDLEPTRIIAANGSIKGNGLILSTSEAIELFSAGDISLRRLSAQNVNGTDVSRIVGGRDLTFATERTPEGALRSNLGGIDIAGPGRLDVVLGRHLDLGNSDGIVSLGDQNNPALANRGADIKVLTGFSFTEPVADFLATYAGQADHRQRSINFAKALLGVDELDEDEAFDYLSALSTLDALPLVTDILFGELEAAGKANAADPTVDFSRGFSAIRELFGEDPREGDISLFFSRIHTLDGGGIDLLAPGGFVNAGLSASFAGQKPPDELGVIVRGAGDLRAFVHEDFQINQSRVFALDGGDILIWSSTGDIDAGRGARTAQAAPSNNISFDENGKLVIEVPAAVSGSGIRASVTTPGVRAGDVGLFAPAGAIIASDAPIIVEGNLTVAAGGGIVGDSIEVGGSFVGAPVDVGGVSASLAGSSDVASAAAETAEQSATQGNGSAAAAPLATTAITWLEVFLEGFGDEALPSNRRNKPGCDAANTECEPST